MLWDLIQEPKLIPTQRLIFLIPFRSIPFHCRNNNIPSLPIKYSVSNSPQLTLVHDRKICATLSCSEHPIVNSLKDM